jgi:hypothetical protein
MFFNRSKLNVLFSHSPKREDKLFADVYGCDDIKRLFRMALESNNTCSLLLTGPPASAKTLFLRCLTSRSNILLLPFVLIPLSSFTIFCQNPLKSIYIGAGPEGLEPSTNCSAGSHSIQAELWARSFLRIANHI